VPLYSDIEDKRLVEERSLVFCEERFLVLPLYSDRREEGRNIRALNSAKALLQSRRALNSAKKALYSDKRGSCGRPEMSARAKKAMYSDKRAMCTIKRALYQI